MEQYNKKSLERRSAMFKALGHPTRLWIVEQLKDGEDHCVCEFVKAVGVEFATISRHLSVLKSVGILEDDKRGKEVYYRLCCPCIGRMIDCLEARC